MVELNEINFNKEISCPVMIVDFWAAWCGPCKKLTPILSEIERDNKIKVGTVDIEANAALACKFNVHSLPTMMIFKNGVIDSQINGLVEKTKILERIGM